MLQQVGLEEISEPQVLENLYMVFIPAMTVPIALVLIPDYPPELSVVFKRRVQELVVVLFTLGSLVLAAPVAVGFFSNNLRVFVNTASTASIIALALGAPGLYYTVSGIYMSKIEKALDNALNHVRV
jgi:hypothetical protein